MQALVRPLIQSSFRLAFRIFAAGFALAFFGWHSAHAAAPQTFRGIKVEVVGEGRPVLMVPGLNSAGETWSETCAALQQDHVQCHIVTLPGFAGQPSAAENRPCAQRSVATVWTLLGNRRWTEAVTWVAEV